MRKGSELISLAARIFGLPLPLVIGLMVVRSGIFRRSVRLAYHNRDLATRSGRAVRRQRYDTGEDHPSWDPAEAQAIFW
jgi:hypothetical protein